MTETFKVGDPVWAKMKTYVPWPAKIAEPADSAKKRQNMYWVFFFGTHDCAWIESFNVKPYKKYRSELMNASKGKSFQRGIQEIEKYIETLKDPSSEHSNSSGTEDLVDDPPTPEKPAVSPEKPAKRKKQGVKRSASGSSQTSSKAKQIKTFTGSVDENGTGNASPSKAYEHILNKPTVLDRPDTPPIDLNYVSEKNKDIAPSKLKFGFLGLGIMASGMVKNLINSRHRLNLWCEDASKCESLKSQVIANEGDACLVDVRETPYDVVKNSDIVFCCLSDPRSSKEVVSGQWGVLYDVGDNSLGNNSLGNNSLENKGFVEMTGIDVETSKDLNELITKHGGRYLEAQVQGCKKEADEGNLIILGAGDFTLFNECLSCFKAMGKIAFHLGEVGYAVKMNLILQVMHGVALAGLAEGFALAERSGLTLSDVLKIFVETNLNCPYLYNKASIIISEKFPECQQPLQSMQKDLRLAIGLADSLQQPLLLTSTANELFKHTRRLGFDKHDSASVFVRARH